MNIMHFLIVAMLLIQLSAYAQSTGQVTLSIRLYPIQIIEVAPIETQTLEISSEEVLSTLNQSPSSNQLSTYSTSQFALQVDTLTSSAFDEWLTSNEISSHDNRSINPIVDAERYNYESDGDDLHLMYSMETL